MPADGFAAFAGQLDAAATSFKPRARAIMSKGALEIKRQMKDEARGAGPRVGPIIAATINYDIDVSEGGITAEVGPEKGHAGSLAFFYFGNSRIGPRIPDPMGALESEYSHLKSYLNKLVDL